MHIDPSIFRSYRLCLPGATATVIAFLAGALCSIGSSPSNESPVLRDPTSASSQRFPLAINPDPITFGVVGGRTLAQRLFSARNTRNAPFVLERVETSCPCIRVAPLPVKLEANETRNWTVTFDPLVDPTFEGRLSVEIIGYLAGGQIAFRTNVNLNVRPVLNGPYERTPFSERRLGDGS